MSVPRRPAKCGKRNEDFREDVAFDELARSAPATALVDAARSGTGRVAALSAARTRTRPSRATRVTRRPRAKSTWSWTTPAKALVLSLAWYSTDQDGNDVAALLELVWRDAPMPVEKVFSKNPNGRQRGSKAGPRKLDLFAVAVFQNAHYTAFVRVGRLGLVDVPRPALGRRRRDVCERRAAVPRRADAAVLAVLRRADYGAGELTIGGSVD